MSANAADTVSRRIVDVTADCGISLVASLPPLVSWYSARVFSRLMMWILFRSPKMKGAIFGFQKRV